MGLKFEKDTGELRDCMLVHEPGQPGSLVIDHEHGVILTANLERTDWADGLVVRLLDEHRNFYTTRLGSYSAPEIFARSELSWGGLNEEVTEIEVEADAEYRM